MSLMAWIYHGIASLVDRQAYICQIASLPTQLRWWFVLWISFFIQLYYLNLVLYAETEKAASFFIALDFESHVSPWIVSLIAINVHKQHKEFCWNNKYFPFTHILYSKQSLNFEAWEQRKTKERTIHRLMKLVSTAAQSESFHSSNR